VPVLALAGLRWGELAGLQVGDRVSVPGPGLRLSRAVLAARAAARCMSTHWRITGPGRCRWWPSWCRSSTGGARGKEPEAWLFAAPGGGPLRESNWKRSVGWRAATWQPLCRMCAFTICATPRHRCGWPLARTRRWCSGCWGIMWVILSSW